MNLFTFVALMVSAIAQALNNSISLYNAIIVIYLCYLYSMGSLMLFIMSVPKEKMEHPLVHVGIVKMMAFSLPFWLWSFFGICVWIDPTGFGSQPECNAATKLIVLGRELSATGSGRVVTLGE